MNNKGITLTSLLIYIIGMAITIGVIATLTSFFYKNIDIGDIENDTTTQYTKFSSIFLQETNEENNEVIDCKKTEENGTKINYIIFSNGNQYTYNSSNKSIYKNEVKICQNVDECDFSYTFVDGIYKITVNFKTASIDLTEANAVTYNM